MRPDYLCCHRHWPVCLLDNLAHDLFRRGSLPRPLRWLCDAHDRLITGAAR